MNISITKLRELCNKYTLTVSFNGFNPFTEKIIDANLLLEEIHLISDLPKDDFIKNINTGNFVYTELESIFRNIESQGTFLIKGYEQLGGHSFIKCKNLKWL